MLIRSGYEIEVACDAPVPLILALGVHDAFPGRIIGEDRVRMGGADPLPTYLDAYGNRITRCTAPAGTTTFHSDFVVETGREPDPQLPQARQHAVEDLPDEVLTYLLASRYCDSDVLIDEAWALFGRGPTGWARVQAVTDFVHGHVTFGYQFGRPDKTASDVLREKSGVCRDFAHLAIALCRALNIPARYASGYLGDIDWPDSGPGDFCAWFEVYLDGAWHTFDARYNAPRIGRVLMVRGPDAGQVAMLTSFGGYRLRGFRVWSQELDAGLPEADIRRLLQTRPDAAALVAPPAAQPDAPGAV
jgi:transglutaminase-like putative cysteine protease